ncbi:F-box/LRR-repeat protein 18 [Neosynchiropus ocellatus]
MLRKTQLLLSLNLSGLNVAPVEARYRSGYNRIPRTMSGIEGPGGGRRSQTQDGEDSSPPRAGMSDLSDEILLCVLRHVPVPDLLTNVAPVCRRFRWLCCDKSLLGHVSLSEAFGADDVAVRRLLKQLSAHVTSLSLNGVYWLSGATLERLSRCRSLTRLDVSGCRLTSVRLSRLLCALKLLRSLAFDVAPGFDAAQLSSDAVDGLSRLSELRQTLLTPSYGVVPCCPRLRRLMLQFDICDVTREGEGVSCQLMVGQSSVPHYRHLREFTARLAPGEVNQTLLLLYLAVFSVHVPEHLTVFLVSIPGPNPVPWPAAPSLAGSLGRRCDLEALQLPRSWLDPLSLKQALEGSSPRHLSFSRCPALLPQVFRLLLEGGVKDPGRLTSLNLSGVDHPPYSESCGADGQPGWAAMGRLAEACRNLQHLNLMHTHYHHDDGGGAHLCASLAGLRRLRCLALPACALSDGPDAQPASAPTPSPSPFGRAPRVGLPVYSPDSDSSPSGSGHLLAACRALETLEVIGAGFVSALPRLEPCGRAYVEPRGVCEWARGVGDAHLAALAAAPGLRRLTLAGLPGVLRGTGLVQLARKCGDLQALSLANIGSLKIMNYSAALLDALRQCRQLQELRLEQPYLNANAAFFEALSCCSRLQRLCIVSRGGTFDPGAVEGFMERCGLVVTCHMFMSGTLVACRGLQKRLRDRFSGERPALSAVVYPLHHEELPSVIRDVPLALLDRVTLFQSQVAQPPRLSPC